ncbi:hypothetical protein HK101_005888, partial [Irineochytrium annulatum]
ARDGGVATRGKRVSGFWGTLARRFSRDSLSTADASSPPKEEEEEVPSSVVTPTSRTTASAQRRDAESLEKLIASDGLLSRCPGCSLLSHKESGCNHMTCPLCATHWCLLCSEHLGTGDAAWAGVTRHYDDDGSSPCYGRKYDDPNAKVGAGTAARRRLRRFFTRRD